MRTQRGFTLIELLIVVVIIGILAIIAIPKFQSTKGPAYVSVMRGDLRNVAVAEEAYIADNLVYYGGAVPGTGLIFNPSPNVTVTIPEATAAGWSAKTTHALTTRTCAVFLGSAAPVAPATVSGTVTCSN